MHAASLHLEHSPDAERVAAMHRDGHDLVNTMNEVKENPRPGLVNALVSMKIDGEPHRSGDPGQPGA